MSSAETAKRLVALDVLRAAAVVLILFRHLPGGLAPLRSDAVVWVLIPLTRGGWTGVDLFFVLSGFLVSGLLFRDQQRNGAFSVKRFLIRRGFRIYPPFYTLLFLTLALDLMQDRPIQLKVLLCDLFYLQSYLPCRWGHAWSLAVEEHFYLLLPLLLLVLTRLRRLRQLPLVFLFVSLACLSMRLTLTNTPFSFQTHMTPTHLRLDSLFTGVLVSYLYHYRPELLAPWLSGRRRLLLLAVGVVGVAPAFRLDLFGSYFLCTVGYTLVALGYGAVLLAALGTELSNRGFWRAVTALGAQSYSIYLWHFPVRDLVKHIALEQFPGLPTELWFAVYLVGSIVVGVAFAKAVELPLLRVRDRLFPRRELALSPTPGMPEAAPASEGEPEAGRQL